LGQKRRQCRYHRGTTAAPPESRHTRSAAGQEQPCACLLVLSIPRQLRRRSRISRPCPCAPAHRLVSGEGASTLVPQSGFTYAESPKARVADQTTTRLRTAINLPGRQPPHRWRGKPVDRVSDLECGSFRNDAVFDEAPERDRTEAPVPPERELAVGLIAEPEPSQLDERLTSELGARLADSSIAVDVTALVGAGCEPNERRHVSSRFKRPMVNFGNQHGRRRRAHGAKCRQALNLLGVREASTLVAEGFFSSARPLRSVERPSRTGAACVQCRVEGKASAGGRHRSSMYRSVPASPCRCVCR
jgi:hypothetical protein